MDILKRAGVNSMFAVVCYFLKTIVAKRLTTIMRCNAQ